MRLAGLTLNWLVTIAMGILVILAATRWSRLDSASKWIARGWIVHVGFAVVMFLVTRRGWETRWFFEAVIAIGTPLFLLGFRDWQPSSRSRRLVQFGIPAFALVFLLAQMVQGSRAIFSTVSGPAHSMFLTAAAGYTLITNVQASTEQWTQTPWFWISTGFMLVYGTEVVLDPTWIFLFGARNDLVYGAGMVHSAVSLVGYGFMGRGFLTTPEFGSLGPAGIRV